MFRTKTVLSSLNPKWNSGFVFNGKQVLLRNSVVSFEVFSEDEFHPDDFLGQAELDLNSLPSSSSPGSPLLCNMTLLEWTRAGRREKGDFGELKVQIWLTPDNGKDGIVLSVGGASLPNCWKNNVIHSVALSADGYKMTDRGGHSKQGPQKVLPNVLQTDKGILYEEVGRSIGRVESV